MRIKSLISWLIFIALFAALIVGFVNFQAISDWLKLRDYQPSARIVQLADETTMNSNTRRVFYVNHPELDDKQDFSGRCRTTEQTIVLGCFINNQGIYLLDVTDKRLDGVVEVTAAHETLHAMYERLGSSEREKVDKMTASFFATLKDERIKETIAGYRSKDPAVVPNELHSILGTEVRDLSPDLEDYYKQYFKDRQKIVDYSDKYEQTFIDIESKAKAYDAQLADLKKEIEANEAEARVRGNDLENKQRELELLLAARRVNEYNQQVPVYNNQLEEYNVLAEKTKQQINQYNRLLDERNKLVIQQQELYKSLDSNSIKQKSSR